MISIHGIGIFLSASSTHGGIGFHTGIIEFLGSTKHLLPSLWPFLVAISGVYLVAKREFFLPLWFLAVGFIVGNDEHMMLVGALMIVPLLFDGVLPTLSQSDPIVANIPEMVERINTHRVSSIAAAFFITLIVIYSAGSGIAYVTSHKSTGGTTFINKNDISAMNSVRHSTKPDASFIIIGNTAEWFPLFSHRTSIVAARGSEWLSKKQYRKQHQLQKEFRKCLSAACVSGIISENNLDPNYIYIDRYSHSPTQRELANYRWEILRPDMINSSNFRRIYQHDGVVIFRNNAQNSINRSNKSYSAPHSGLHVVSRQL